MGSHGLCTQTQVRLENPRLRRKDCIVLFPVIFSKGVIGSKGHIMGTAEFLDNEYIFYHVQRLVFLVQTSILSFSFAQWGLIARCIFFEVWGRRYGYIGIVMGLWIYGFCHGRECQMYVYWTSG